MLTFEPGVRVGAAPGADPGSEGYLHKSLIEQVAKRAFDLVFAVAGLVVALPLLAVIAVLIKLDSRGSVFYRQTRVGRYRRPFQILKFRKMYTDLPTQGPSLTRRHDFRMTRFGRVLERTKSHTSLTRLDCRAYSASTSSLSGRILWT